MVDIYGKMRGHLPSIALLEAWEQASSLDPGLTMAVHATRIHIPLAQYQNMIDLGRKLRDGIDPNTDKLFKAWDLPKPWTLQGDWMIVGDVHVPYTDYPFASLVAKVAKKWLPSPRRLLIGGDFFSMDTFSKFVDLVRIPSWQDEKATAKVLLDEWLDVFVEIHMILGNHDRRLQKWTMGALNEDDLLALLVSNPARVKMSSFGYCNIETVTGMWRVTHPVNYSINQLIVGESLSNKLDMNMISFHEHHTSMGWDRYGRHVLVNIGTLADPCRFAYAMLDDSKADAMLQSFCMLRDGTPYLFGTPPFTDWSKWL